MSFNLNRLVQPECGAPNPLVRAAQQIAGQTMAPIRTSVPRTNIRVHNRADQINFAKEFAQTQPPPPLAVQGTSAKFTTSNQRQQAPGTSGQFTMNQNFQRLNINQSQQQQTAPFIMQQPVMVSAGDQLETKYRNDMISEANLAQKNEGKLDDVQFWQSISQAYLGPTTMDNIAKIRIKREAERQLGDQTGQETGSNTEEEPKLSEQEMREKIEEMDRVDSEIRAALLKSDESEYIFDEKNPFKDQIEKPFEEGLKRLEQGDIPSAALLFEAAVQQDPAHVQAWRYLGTTQAQNEKDKSAIRALTKCLELDGSDLQARLAISVSLVNESRHREACQHLIQWLASNERYKTVNASVSEFHALDEEPAEMVAVVQSKHYNYVRDKFVEAARMSPNNPDPEVQSSLGVLFNMFGDYAKAVDCFKAALSVNSEDSLLWNRLGATLANSNKSDEAVLAYRRALEIAPGFLRTRYNLAISLIHLNLYEEAAKQLVQILNSQAAGRGSKGDSASFRARSITSTSVWNTLRTVATLMNKPDLYPTIDGRDLERCNQLLLNTSSSSGVGTSTS